MAYTLYAVERFQSGLRGCVTITILELLCSLKAAHLCLSPPTFLPVSSRAVPGGCLGHYSEALSFGNWPQPALRSKDQVGTREEVEPDALRPFTPWN